MASLSRNLVRNPAGNPTHQVFRIKCNDIPNKLTLELEELQRFRDTAMCVVLASFSNLDVTLHPLKVR